MSGAGHKGTQGQVHVRYWFGDIALVSLKGVEKHLLE